MSTLVSPGPRSGYLPYVAPIPEGSTAALLLSRPQRAALGIAAFVILSVADLVLTHVLLTSTDDAIYEANPLANFILECHGWSGLTVFKLTAVALISSIILYVGKVRPLTGRRLLTFACGLMIAVVIYSAYLVTQFVGSAS
jgi:hypothetical protein